MLRTFTLFVCRDTLSANDDVIQIREANEDGYYTVEYRENYSNKNKSLVGSYYFTAEQIHEWLRTLLRSLAMDDAPFKALQVCSPCFPSVYMNIPSLQSRAVRRNLLSMFDFTKKGWVNNYLAETGVDGGWSTY